jgi:hypothetical protein
MQVSLAEFISIIAPNTGDERSVGWLEIENTLWRSAASSDPYDKRMLLLITDDDVVLLHERDVLIKDSDPFNSVLERSTAPGIMGYFIYAARLEGELALLDVFEAGSINEYVNHLTENALPSSQLVLVYKFAEQLVVDTDEYHSEREKFQSHRGKPLDYSYYIPQDMRKIERLMGAEQLRRMEYACGNIKTDFGILTER